MNLAWDRIRHIADLALWSIIEEINQEWEFLLEEALAVVPLPFEMKKHMRRSVQILEALCVYQLHIQE